MSKHCPQGKAAKTVPFFVGVSTLGHTEGKTGSVHHGLILQGGHNVTLKEKRHHHECATIKINARDQSIQTQSLFDLIISGNTIGVPSLVSSGTLTLAGGNNVTLSQNGNAITILAGAQTGQPWIQAISAGTTKITMGDAVFLNSNNISFGINGQTITGSYDLLSHNSVYHTGTVGAESQISFDTLSGHDHDGTNSRLLAPIPQYLEVAISGKQFTSVKTAIDSIVDASPTKPYVVKVYPGIYTESPFSMQQYVTIEGSEYYATTIQTNDNTNHFITGKARSAIRNASIVGPTGTGKAAVYYTDQTPATTAPFVLQDILIRKGYYGVWTDATVSTTVIHLINVTNWYSSPTAMHTFARATGYGVVVAISSGFMCGASDAITIGFEADGANSELYLDQCYFRGTPVANTIVGVYVDNGGYAVLSACTFSKGTIALQIGPNGSGSEIYAATCIIRNDAKYFFTTDIKIDNALATIDYNGIASRTKLDITAGASFIGNFTDVTTGAEGTVNLGEFYLGDLNNQLPLRSYGITTYSAGWVSGGAVTTAGGLNVNVANGSGYINSLIATKAIAWLDATIVCAPNSRQYIYIDSSGVALVDTNEPDEGANVLLAVMQTDATDVRFIFRYRTNLSHQQWETEEYAEYTMGPVVARGCIATELSAPSKRIAVTDGNYFLTLEGSEVIGASPATFTYWYKNPTGNWTTIISQTDIDTVQYNDITTGTLVTMSAGKFKKDLIYVSVNGSDTEYHVIYGQAEFDTQALAENGSNPTSPSAFIYALPIAGIITSKDDDTHIIEIIDARPTGHYTPPGHNTLPGLQGGISSLSQYYHINSTEHANLSQKIVAISGSNDSISGNTISFGNSNNLSFYITDGSVVGSFNQSTQPAVQQLNNSSGSMNIVGGDNITVNNNNSTISIYGPANILNSLSISGNNAYTNSSNITGGGFVIAGGDNITLSQENNTISIYGRSPHAAIQSLSAGTTQITIGQAVFADDNNVTFGIDGYTITASVHAQQTGISSIIASDITYTQGNVQFAGAGIVTISANNTNNPITINASQAAITGIAGSAASTVVTGLVQFANANNISFGLNSNTMTASYSQSAEQRIISLNGTSGELSLSGASNITVSALNGSVITIYGPANILNSLSISGNNAYTNSSNITGGGFVIAGGNNITLSQSNNTISIYGAGAGTGAAINAIEAGTVTGTTGTIKFADANNVTFGMATNGSVITAIASFDATNVFGGIVASNATYTTGVVIFTGVGGGITVSSNTGQRVDLSVAAQSIQTENMVSVNGSTGAISISGGNNITVGNNNSVITISGPNTHAQQIGISSIIASDITYTQGSVQFTGAGIVTISANNTNNPITINAQQTIQPGIQSLSAGTTRITTGQVSFANSNNVIFGIDGQTITASVHAQQTGISSIIASNITYTQGSVRFVGAGAVTVSANNTSNPITINAPVQTLQTLNMHALLAYNNTSGLFTIGTSGTVSFAGTNITITANTANSSILGFSVHPQQTAISGIQASDTIYTSGTVIFTGVGGGITIQSNTNQRIDLSVVAQSTQTQNLHGLVVSNNISNPITIGTSGTVSFAGTNITITANTANNSIIGFSVANPVGAGIGSISAGATNITSGQVVFSNSNNVSFGANGQTVTASVANPGILSIFAGTTRATAGEVVFVNANSISFGMNANTVTASFSQSVQTQNTYAVPILSKWENVVIGDTQHSQSMAAENATFWLVDMAPGAPVFPGNMTVSTMFIDVEGDGTVTAANSHTLNVGIYTRNVSTLSLLNSVRTTWGFSANANNTRLYSGVRFITIHSSLWSAQPTFSQENYYLGFLAQSAGNSIGLSIRGNYYLVPNDVRFGTMGVSTTAGNTSMGQAPFVGMSTASRTNLPASIQLSELRKTGSLYGFLPHMIFYNVSSNF